MDIQLPQSIVYRRCRSDKIDRATRTNVRQERHDGPADVQADIQARAGREDRNVGKLVLQRRRISAYRGIDLGAVRERPDPLDRSVEPSAGVPTGERAPAGPP